MVSEQLSVLLELGGCSDEPAQAAWLLVTALHGSESGKQIALYLLRWSCSLAALGFSGSRCFD